MEKEQEKLIKATGEFAGKTVDTLIEKILKASKAVKE